MKRLFMKNEDMKVSEQADSKVKTIEDFALDALEAHKIAEKKWHAYACELPVGDERTLAFDIYERIRLATRAN